MIRRESSVLLAAIFAATSLLTAAPALADGHGHDRGHGKGRTEHSASYRRDGANEERDRQNGGYGRGYAGQAGAPGDPHGCVNPAGHERGWCKGGNGYSGNRYGSGAANAQVHGIVTAVNGDTVTILQGLLGGSVTIDDQAAVNNGAANAVYVGRTITAYGYWQNGVFYATSIQ